MFQRQQIDFVVCSVNQIGYVHLLQILLVYSSDSDWQLSTHTSDCDWQLSTRTSDCDWQLSTHSSDCDWQLLSNSSDSDWQLSSHSECCFSLLIIIFFFSFFFFGLLVFSTFISLLVIVLLMFELVTTPVRLLTLHDTQWVKWHSVGLQHTMSQVTQCQSTANNESNDTVSVHSTQWVKWHSVNWNKLMMCWVCVQSNVQMWSCLYVRWHLLMTSLCVYWRRC